MNRLSLTVIATAAAGAVVGLFASETVRARSEPAQPAAPALIAVCNITELTSDLLMSEKHKPIWMKKHGEISEESKALYEETTRLYEKLKGLEQPSPEYDRAMRDYTEARKNYDAVAARLSAEYEKVWRDETALAFDEARAVATQVAIDRGFTYLIASDTTKDPLDTANTKFFTSDYASRIVLLFPEETDITSEIRRVLNVKHEELPKN